MSDSVFTAEFAQVRDAQRFEKRLSGEPESWFYVPGTLVRTGKVVMWERDLTRSTCSYHEYLQDMLETVGFYGSAPTGRKAKLNGFQAPPSW